MARIIKLRTWITVRCVACGHSARIGIHLEHVGKLKCSKCGDKHPIVAGREPLRQWAKYRRGA